MLKACAVAALALLVGCAGGLYNQGRSMVERGQYDQAIELFYGQIKAEPGSAVAWRELGIAFFKKGDLAKAEDALKQANNIQPDSRTNLYLGLVYEKQEMYGKAIDAYRASLSLKPESKIEAMVRSHLDGLVIKKVRSEATEALANEAGIDVDTIPENTIAVVDFDNTHLPPDMAPISKGLAEFTALDLGKVASLRVVDRMKIDAIMGELKLSSSKYADPSTAPRMGRLVGSRRIVTGSLLGIGDKTIQLDGAVVNTRDSSTAVTGAMEGDLDKIFAVEKSLVFKVIDNLGIALTAEERDAIEKIPTESYLAFMAYCRGLEYKSQGMYEAARQEFRQAQQEDNGFQEAGVQVKALASAPATASEEPGAFEQFELGLSAASDQESSQGGIDRFQNGLLADQDFIRDSEKLDRHGNTPDSPDRTSDITGMGTVTIRGNLDAQP